MTVISEKRLSRIGGMDLISITKLNDKEIILNCELIESIESTPDTTITTTTGKKFIAKESVDDVIDKVISFKRRIYTDFK